MDVDSKVLEKIRRLLALSHSSNEHEAALAAAKAQELLFKYNLSANDVPGESVRREDFERQFIDVGNGATWRIRLIHAVSKYNFGKVIVLDRIGKLALIAEPHNAEVILYIYQYVRNEIDRLADEAWAAQGKVGNARSWKGSFRLGAVQAVADQLKAQRGESEQADDNSRALVLAKDTALAEKVRELYPLLRKNRSSPRIDSSGWAAGKRAGENISIRRGVKSGGGGSRVAGYLT